MSGIEYVTIRELTSDQIKKVANIPCKYYERGKTCTNCCMVQGAYCIKNICVGIVKTGRSTDGAYDLKICKARLLKHGVDI